LQRIIWRRCHEKGSLVCGKAIGYGVLLLWAFVCKGEAGHCTLLCDLGLTLVVDQGIVVVLLVRGP
jgi:hypothetical protein